MSEAQIIELDASQLDGCLALSKASHWNQNAADWRWMLGSGSGWGVRLADGTLAASTLILPYGGFAWVSMVLVHPAHRRRGHASRLLRHALAALRDRGLTPVLDATPDGQTVYRREGFQGHWGFQRYALAARAAIPAAGFGGTVRACAPGDWAAIAGQDAIAFGADRSALLRSLAARLPGAALVAEERGAITGYLFGREGREAMQLGPLVADRPAVATALLACALDAVTQRPLYVDAVDGRSELLDWLARAGFAPQRPFLRMVFGAAPAPGEAGRIHLVAGPELG